MDGHTVAAPRMDEELASQLTDLREIFVDETGLNQFGELQINNQTFHPLGVRTPRKFGYQYAAFNEDAFDRLAQVQLEESVTEDELREIMGLQYHTTSGKDPKNRNPGTRNIEVFMISVKKRAGYAEGFAWL